MKTFNIKKTYRPNHSGGGKGTRCWGVYSVTDGQWESLVDYFDTKAFAKAEAKRLTDREKI